MKTRIGVFFGGISVEHEVSVISAVQAMESMDEDRYEIVPIYISKERKWYTGDILRDIEAYKDMPKLLNEAQQVLITYGEEDNVVLQKKPAPKFGKKEVAAIDVAFPIVHGTFGEDGALQGLFELYGLPYVGCDVASSAVGMDKVMMKQILRDSRLPVLNDVWFYSNHWAEDTESVIAMIEESVPYPVIVKPANLGSSVGIGTAKNREELEQSVEEATEFAGKILVEKMLEGMTEVNCSVVGDYEDVEASVIEKVLKTDEILSYKDKYQGGKNGSSSKGMEATDREIPAPITEEKAGEVRELAKDTFQILGCSGVSRIDFLIEDSTETVFVNEINTIPGSLSFYLWDPAGKSYSELIHQLIQLALKRKRERERLTFSIDSNLFSLQSGQGSKGGTKTGSASNR